MAFRPRLASPGDNTKRKETMLTQGLEWTSVSTPWYWVKIRVGRPDNSSQSVNRDRFPPPAATVGAMTLPGLELFCSASEHLVAGTPYDVPSKGERSRSWD